MHTPHHVICHILWHIYTAGHSSTAAQQQPPSAVCSKKRCIGCASWCCAIFRELYEPTIKKIKNKKKEVRPYTIYNSKQQNQKKIIVSDKVLIRRHPASPYCIAHLESVHSHVSFSLVRTTLFTTELDYVGACA